MGYELRLHIAQEWTPAATNDDIDRQFGRSVEQLAMVMLSKPGYDTNIYKLVREQQELEKRRIAATGIKYMLYTGYVDSKGEEKKIFQDAYGEPITPIPFREIYRALLRDYADSMSEGEYTDGYRRFALAISMFEAVLNRFPEHLGKDRGRPLIVLTYGY